MSKFVSNKLQKIDVGDGEYIEIPESLSYKQVMEITEGKTETEVAKSMLLQCVKKWNIKDDEGNIPEVNEENIMRLDIRIIKKLTDEITPLLSDVTLDKKK